LPLMLITTTALSRLCGSTPITTLATASSPCFELPGRREGSATSSVADPSRATPHRSVSDGQRSIRQPHPNPGGQPDASQPAGHLSPRLAGPEPGRHSNK
jgi:hypothetical protein